MNHELDRLGEPFPVLPGVTIPVGEYAMTSASVRFSSNQSRRFFASVDMEGGSFFGGDEQEYGGEVFYKFSKHLSVGANIERNEFSLPGLDVDPSTTIVGIRVFAATGR